MHVWTLILVFHQDMNHRKEIYDILQPGFISTYKKKPLSIILLLNKCKKKIYCCFAIFRYPYRNSPVLSYGQCRHGNILITDHTNMTLQITNFFLSIIYENLFKVYSIVNVCMYMFQKWLHMWFIEFQDGSSNWPATNGLSLLEFTISTEMYPSHYIYISQSLLYQ